MREVRSLNMGCNTWNYEGGVVFEGKALPLQGPLTVVYHVWCSVSCVVQCIMCGVVYHVWCSVSCVV